MRASFNQKAAGMSFLLWSQFVLAISLLIVSPGPSATLVIQYSKQPHSVYLAAILGGNLASMVLLVLAAVGLSLIQHEGVLLILQLLGTLYLLYLGFSMLRSHTLMRRGRAEDTAKEAWIKGLLVGISNPKDIIFFASFLSIFLPDNGQGWLSALFILLATWTVVDWLVMLGYAALFRRQQWLNATGLNRVCGLVLCVLALLLCWNVVQGVSGLI